MSSQQLAANLPLATSHRPPVRIGVLALQGAFREHCRKLEQVGVDALEVRLPSELHTLHGLIIPGGESTTMGKLAESYGLVEPLRQFSRQQPVWGTCAGMILLAEHALGQKQGGQPLIGGLDITVDRNYFGRQIDSFEIDLTIPALAGYGANGDSGHAFHAVFIRAPAVVAVGPAVEVLARLPDNVVVAVRQGRLLATAFHPELSQDLRFHRYFADLVTETSSSLQPNTSKH